MVDGHDPRPLGSPGIRTLQGKVYTVNGTKERLFVGESANVSYQLLLEIVVRPSEITAKKSGTRSQVGVDALEEGAGVHSTVCRAIPWCLTMLRCPASMQIYLKIVSKTPLFLSVSNILCWDRKRVKDWKSRKVPNNMLSRLDNAKLADLELYRCG